MGDRTAETAHPLEAELRPPERRASTGCATG